MNFFRGAGRLRAALVLALLGPGLLHAQLPAGAIGTGTGWGRTGYCELCLPADTRTNLVAIAAAGSYGLGLRGDGSVSLWGYLAPPNLPGNLGVVQAIAAGGEHCLALQQNGTVVAWGGNSYYQTNVPSWATGVKLIAAGEYHSLVLRSNGSVGVWGSLSTVPAGLYGPFVSAIAAGSDYNVAIYNGRIVQWTDPFHSQPGQFGQVPIPAQATNGTWYMTSVAAGRRHVLAVTSAGSVVGWGDNTFGQATAPTGLGSVLAVAAGDSFSVALTAERKVVAWGWAGDPGDNITTPPAGLSNVFGIAAGLYHSLALYGVPLSVLTQPQSQVVSLGSPVTLTVAVSGSPTVSYQWRKNGNAIPGATGPAYSLSGVQISDEAVYSVALSNFVGSTVSSNALLTVKAPPVIASQPQSAVATAGNSASFAVGATGSLPLRYQWRRNGAPLANATNSSLTLLSVQAGDAGDYTAVITNVWGAITSSVASLTVNLPPTILVQPQSQTVTVGASVTFSVSAANALTYQWRKNNTEVAGATNALYALSNTSTNDAGVYIVRVSNPYGSLDSAAASLQVQVLGCGGTTNVVGWGLQMVWASDHYIDLNPPCGLANIVGLAAGTNHNLALKLDGTLLGWGDNSFGQSAVPAGLAAVQAIAAGGDFSLALKADGGVRAWGQNDFGQTNVPVGLTNVVAIAAGATHALALRGDGVVQGWGNPAAGRATPPPGVAGFRAIAAGVDHSLGLKTNGTVVGWGGSTYGQASPPPLLTDPATAQVMAIAAGSYHSLALQSNGSVQAWGYNGFGQTDVPPGLPKVSAIAAGDQFSLALLRNGRLVAWGQDFFGQVSGVTNLSGLVGVAAGGARGLAIQRGQLRLRALRPVGSVTRTNLLLIGNLDGSAIEDYRRGRISMQCSTNLWIGWAGCPGLFTPVGGQLRFEDIVGTNRQSRYYRTVEQP